MKTSKEMADAVLRIRDEYTEQKRRRSTALKRAALIGVPAFAAFALLIGVGVSLDRQEIGADGSVSLETAPVTAAETMPVTSAETAADSRELIGAAPTSRVTKKQTQSVPLPEAEEASPATMIPDDQPEPYAEPSGEAAPPQTTTTAELTEGEPEIASAEAFRPDEDPGAAPATVNETAALTPGALCDMYPTLHVAGEYVCTGETVAADKLGDVIAEMAVEGSAGYATVYSLEAGQIAVQFGVTDFYIVYKAKEV